MSEAVAQQKPSVQPPPPPPPKAAEPARLLQPITVDRVKDFGVSNFQFWVTLRAGTQPDDILPVAFWMHLGAKFSAAIKEGENDIEVIVRTEDLKWKARLTVIAAGDNWAKVVFETTEKGERIITPLGGVHAHERIVMLTGHTVNFSGIFEKWRVVRDADGAVLSRNHSSEMDAYRWLSEYAKSIQPR